MLSRSEVQYVFGDGVTSSLVQQLIDELRHSKVPRSQGSASQVTHDSQPRVHRSTPRWEPQEPQPIPVTLKTFMRSGTDGGI